MLRTGLWTLRQPRYAAMAALMTVVALGCIAAGTWQVSRFRESVRNNNALEHNAHAAAIALTTTLVPLAGERPQPSRFSVDFRTVTVTGSYLPAPPQFLRNQSLNGVNGYYVLTPLRTASGVLLVVRGFVAGDNAGNPPATVTAPPAGPVQIAGRLQSADTNRDDASSLTRGQLESVNPIQQAARLGTGVYDTYVTLTANQPGTAGVSVLPDPDLSNPAGGAYEWQHFAYIVQWYLFAILALAAPFAIGRSEARDAQRRFLGIDPGEQEIGLEPEQLTAGSSSGGAVAIRAAGTLAVRGGASAAQWQRANRLADRYGRSLGVGLDGPREPVDPPPARTERASAAGPDARPPDARPLDARPLDARPLDARPPDSSARPYRSLDAHHGAYNDYLWELALADGAAPPVPVSPAKPSRAPAAPSVINPKPINPSVVNPTPPDETPES